MPSQVVGYEYYLENSTMYNNVGYESYQAGAIDYYGYKQYSSDATNALIGDPGNGNFGSGSWNPPPTSSISNYTLSFGVSAVGIPTVSVGIALPPGTSESISGSLNPAASTSLPGVPVIQVSNITWTFNIYKSVNQEGFPNSFEDITPANIFLPNFNPSQSYSAIFNVDFENYAVTAQYICAYYTTETIWTNVGWNINVAPQSATTSNVTQTYPGIYLQVPSGSPYVSGVTSSWVLTPCSSP